MSNQISRYPAARPHASHINHDKPAAAEERTNFIISGKDFDPEMKVSFWDLKNHQEITDVRTKPVSVDGDDCAIEASVQLSGHGMYQLMLQNPGGPKHAQGASIYVSDS